MPENDGAMQYQHYAPLSIIPVVEAATTGRGRQQSFCSTYNSASAKCTGPTLYSNIQSKRKQEILQPKAIAAIYLKFKHLTAVTRSMMVISSCYMDLEVFSMS